MISKKPVNKMDKLSKNNLKDFCRICLASPSISLKFYELCLLPELSKLMIRFTSLDVDEEQATYPKVLCQCCYDKLLDYQEFRKLALRSTETLFGIWKGTINCSAVDGTITRTAKLSRYIALSTKANAKEKVKDKLSSTAANANGDWLLPDSNVFEIKSEPIEIDATQPKTSDTVKQKQPFELSAAQNKMEDEEEACLYENEIDSEYYAETEIATLGTSYHFSIEVLEDEDGSTNTSSNPHTIAYSDALSQRSGYKRRSLQCPHCDKRFYKQVNLDAHIRGVHEGHERPFLCTECGSSFSHYNQMRVHIDSKHQMPTNSDFQYTCNFDGCNAKFKSNKNLITHIKVMHSNAPCIGLQDIIELHRAQLNTEIEVDLICQQCCKKFNSRNDLNIHLKRHLQIKEHVCKVCGVAKVTSTELLTHMRRHDKNCEKFKCPLCPKLFKHKNAIGRHVRVIHDGVRAYSCQYCDRRFGTRQTAEAHERIHTGETSAATTSTSKISLKSAKTKLIAKI